jgi:hypothetical protein
VPESLLEPVMEGRAENYEQADDDGMANPSLPGTLNLSKPFKTTTKTVV